jgi:DNA polymerase III subunit delta
MNFTQFLTAFPRAHAAKIYLFTGPETYHHHQGRKMILDRYLPAEKRDFGYGKFGDTSEEWYQGLSLARTLPFGADLRIIVFRGPDVSRPSNVESLGVYLRQASPKSILVVETDKSEKGSLLENLAVDHGFLIECPLLTPAERKKWIQDFARQQGYTLDYAAVSLATDRAGNNLWEISCQMNKVFDWMDSPGPIAAKTLEMLLPTMQDTTIWKILDALSEGDTAKALQANATSLDRGEAPVALLIMIVRQIRNWYIAKEMLQEGKSKEEAMKILKIPPFKATSFFGLVQNLPVHQLRGLYSSAVQYDRQMKSSRMPPKILLESLIIKIAALVRSSTGSQRRLSARV